MSAAPLGSRLSLADFLCITSSFAVPAELTDPKAVFLERVGLKDDCYTHQQIFDQMVDDALRALEQSKPRIYREQFDQAVFERVAVLVYQLASNATLPLYDLMGGQDDNWVTRWLLWHVMDRRPGDYSDTTSGTSHSPGAKSEETGLTSLTAWPSRRSESGRCDNRSPLISTYKAKKLTCTV
nr:hypothetical protein CFP56_41264 [Quercus suber]